MKRKTKGVLLLGAMLLPLIAEFLFAQTAEGLITPEGTVSVPTALLNFFSLSTRLLALFAGPPALAFALGTYLFERFAKRAG
jgi:hypothetical protein